jgi:hypothetical protein
VCQTTDLLYQTFNPVITTDSYELWDIGHSTSCVCDYGTFTRSTAVEIFWNLPLRCTSCYEQVTPGQAATYVSDK